MKKACVISSAESWHYQDLKRGSNGRLIVQNFEFGDLAATVGAVEVNASESVLGRLQDYDCIFVRAMPAGSLQQVVFRMDVLLELERRGVRIVNPPRCIEMCVDKYLSLTRLSAAELPVPPTAISQSMDHALKHFEQLGGDVVVKPLFGSMGQRIIRIDSRSDAENHFEQLVNDQEVIYQQRFLDHGGVDIRLLVIGEYVFGMRRTNTDHWITNIAQGGVGQWYKPTDLEIQLALQAARATNAVIAGIDLVQEKGSPHPYIVELNSAPAWRELSKFHDEDIAQLILNVGLGISGKTSLDCAAESEGRAD